MSQPHYDKIIKYKAAKSQNQHEVPNAREIMDQYRIALSQVNILQSAALNSC